MGHHTHRRLEAQEAQEGSRVWEVEELARTVKAAAMAAEPSLKFHTAAGSLPLEAGGGPRGAAAATALVAAGMEGSVLEGWPQTALSQF